MNRLERLFSHKREDILNIYFTAGYPGLEDTVPLIRALDEAGADLIEVGMPYSDPLADGPTIQESGQAAIRNGMSIPKLFEQLKEVRQYTDIPLVLMGYFNPVMQYGEQRFFEHCAEAGIDGLILPDLPIYEYEHFYKAQIEGAGLQISFLITPQTSEERIRKIDQLSTGFVYMVSDASITGAKRGISTKQIEYFERIKGMGLRNPRLIGFGISSHEAFSTACRYANGAIIGSAFIRALKDGKDVQQTVHDFVNSIRQPASV
ncbi:MAG: tryptophan synthase subunit alpha [Bacteroidetes bacterium]|jgi:tryptophan synthase alpha chain|nr:tryptophan synthase subunit alpha [Bacteroidota bacterium]